VDVAYDWKVRPSVFGICAADDDFAVMTAYTRVSGIIKAHQAQLQEEQMEKASRPRRKAR